MVGDSFLAEARRLYRLGFAIHWLRPKSKVPFEGGWTTGPRKSWAYLKETYRRGMNIGVRLGSPSAIDARGYLAVIDVDVKSEDSRHRDLAVTTARRLLNGLRCPVVRSGRGNGSRHYYVLSQAPFKGFDATASSERVKVKMPSVKPSAKELKALSEKEIAEGIRLRPAWEVTWMSEGRQVVLPPSLHPDTGLPYRWSTVITGLGDLPVLREIPEKTEVEGHDAGDVPAKPVVTLDGFKVEPVDLGWLPVSDEIRDGILTGKGVTDRSGYLLKASSALISSGLSQNEVLSVLTDNTTYLGACAYDHAQTTSRRRAAEWVYRYTVERVSKERSAIQVFKSLPLPTAVTRLTAEGIRKQTIEFTEDRPWEQDLVTAQNGVPLKIVQNVVHILTEKVGSDVICRDEFAFRDTYRINAPWGGKKGEVVSDDDIASIKYWLGCNFKFEPNSNIISDALVVLARRNTYDPVKDTLEALPEWDGKERLDSWLPKNFQARGDREYLAQVFRKWMTAMVMRVYLPGVKFDWMPIFEGAQGIGKSSFGRMLVGDKYFLDWLPNLNEKDAGLSLQGIWGVELGELSQFRRTELESIKAFLTRTIDKMRPPYGRRLIESPRRCVFFGTTNRKTYLIDETGNRRFKPIVVGDLNFDALRRDRIQLFAEAKWNFDNGRETERTLDLTGNARNFERTLHSEKMVEDDSYSMEESMRDFIEKIDRAETTFPLERFKILDLFDTRGPLAMWKKENRNLQFASKMLSRLGAKDRKIRGRKVWRLDHTTEADFF